MFIFLKQCQNDNNEWLSVVSLEKIFQEYYTFPQLDHWKFYFHQVKNFEKTSELSIFKLLTLRDFFLNMLLTFFFEIPKETLLIFDKFFFCNKFTSLIFKRY